MSSSTEHKSQSDKVLALAPNETKLSSELVAPTRSVGADEVQSESEKLIAHLSKIAKSTPKKEEGNAEIIAWLYDKNSPKGEWMYMLMGSYPLTMAMDVCSKLVQEHGTEYVTFSVLPKGRFHQINDEAVSFEVLQGSSSVMQASQTRVKVLDEEKKTKAEVSKHMNAESDTKSVEYFSNIVYRCAIMYAKIHQYADEMKTTTTQYKKRAAELETLLKQFPEYRTKWEVDAKTFNEKCGDAQTTANMKHWFDATFNKSAESSEKKT
jgi:hypothetical protein